MWNEETLSAMSLSKFLIKKKRLVIDLGTLEHWRHIPPRFCNKQRNILFIFIKCSFFLRNIVPWNCHVPKLEMLPRALSLVDVFVNILTQIRRQNAINITHN